MLPFNSMLNCAGFDNRMVMVLSLNNGLIPMANGRTSTHFISLFAFMVISTGPFKSKLQYAACDGDAYTKAG